MTETLARVNYVQASHIAEPRAWLLRLVHNFSSDLICWWYCQGKLSFCSPVVCMMDWSLWNKQNGILSHILHRVLIYILLGAPTTENSLRFRFLDQDSSVNYLKWKCHMIKPRSLYAPDSTTKGVKGRANIIHRNTTLVFCKYHFRKQPNICKRYLSISNTSKRKIRIYKWQNAINVDPANYIGNEIS